MSTSNKPTPNYCIKSGPDWFRRYNGILDTNLEPNIETDKLNSYNRVPAFLRMF